MTLEELLQSKLVGVKFVYGGLDKITLRTPEGILYAVHFTADYDRSVLIENIVEVTE